MNKICCYSAVALTVLLSGCVMVPPQRQVVMPPSNASVQQTVVVDPGPTYVVVPAVYPYPYWGWGWYGGYWGHGHDRR